MAPSSLLRRSILLSLAIPGQFRKLKGLVSNIWSQQLLRPKAQCITTEETLKHEVKGEPSNPTRKMRVPCGRKTFAQNPRVQLTALKRRLVKRQSKIPGTVSHVKTQVHANNNESHDGKLIHTERVNQAGKRLRELPVIIYITNV